MDFKTANINISDELSALMEKLGIKESDVREVIDYAETSGKKAYIEGEDHFLARKRIGTFSAYVEYVLTDDGAELVDTYSHTVMLAEDEE